jgi:hypothetical protein
MWLGSFKSPCESGASRADHVKDYFSTFVPQTSLRTTSLQDFRKNRYGTSFPTCGDLLRLQRGQAFLNTDYFEVITVLLSSKVVYIRNGTHVMPRHGV